MALIRWIAETLYPRSQQRQHRSKLVAIAAPLAGAVGVETARNLRRARAGDIATLGPIGELKQLVAPVGADEGAERLRFRDEVGHKALIDDAMLFEGEGGAKGLREAHHA